MEDIATTFSQVKPGVSLKWDIDDFEIDIKTDMNIGIIINELISNSYKHAFPTNSSGLIHVSTKKDDNIHTIIVKDNGTGVTKEHQILSQKIFGMTLIHALTDQLNGKLKVGSNGGTSFRIAF